MKNRHLLLAIGGALLVVIGVMALWWPVFLNQYDQFGMQISCGRAYSADLSQAAAGGDALVAKCGTALLIRRVWAIPTAILGWVIVTVLVAAWLHHAPKTEEALV
ncbi:hypothetical protein [Mycobacterium shimoidei]|uniref:Transmembrane protein n=1 Tax=Mycobacterium shimoidei TaxID=29313 RepID=A0A1E3TC89_MYCSH|nr:hypothetical protein [Mycobacterium shimoidei]MCV7257719.1 hypothetical protein [Mycobacterium shimoidei]ODR11945.1 hypothetical protein BHQ16_17770 [Mycobacterium shimoidei]ORW81527.1 hypothetical protein AWC26_07770 [Mycobacterium shimoidei]SRX92387.1 hypothetical protein MSP7336_00612 [Mycobacterium shimoidei]